MTNEWNYLAATDGISVAWVVFLVGIGWVLPILVCVWLAERDGKDAGLVLMCTLFFGWLGGLFSLVLLKPNEEKAEENRMKNTRGKTKPQRESPPQVNQVLSEARKKELEKLLGGK